MREIKFRGKAIVPVEELENDLFKHNNGWVYGNLIYNKGVPWIVGNIIEADPEYIVHEFWVRVYPKSVGQFTGLCDKNGKEIYEGDILRCIFEDENYIVEWDEIGAGFLFHRINNRKRTSGIDYYEFEDICGSFGFEVIGNIFDHPHLLEGEKE